MSTTNYTISQNIISEDTEGDYIFDNTLKGDIKLNPYQVATLDRMLKHEEERIIDFIALDSNYEMKKIVDSLKAVVQKFHCYLEDDTGDYSSKTQVSYVNPSTDFLNKKFRVKTNIGILSNTVGSGKTYVMSGLLKNKRLIDDVGKHTDIMRQEFKELLTDLTDLPDDIIGELSQFAYDDEPCDVVLETRKLFNESMRKSVQNSFLRYDMMSFTYDSYNIVEPRTNLIIVPHSLISQWKKDLAKLTDYKVKIIKSVKDINFTTEDIRHNNYLHQYDIVLCTSTKMEELMNIVDEYVLWERLIVDEADTIKLNVLTPPKAKFVWFITATQERLIQTATTRKQRSFVDEILYMSPLIKNNRITHGGRLFTGPPAMQDFDDSIKVVIKTIVNMISIRCDDEYIAEYMKLPEPNKKFNVIDMPFIYEFVKHLKGDKVLIDIFKNNPFEIMNKLGFEIMNRSIRHQFYNLHDIDDIYHFGEYSNIRNYILSFENLTYELFSNYSKNKEYSHILGTSIFLQSYLASLLYDIRRSKITCECYLSRLEYGLDEIFNKSANNSDFAGIRDLRHNSATVNAALRGRLIEYNSYAIHSITHIPRLVYSQLLPKIAELKSIIKKLHENKFCLSCCKITTDYNKDTLYCNKCTFNDSINTKILMPIKLDISIRKFQNTIDDIDRYIHNKKRYIRLFNYKKYDNEFLQKFNEDIFENFDFNKFDFEKKETFNLFNKMKHFSKKISKIINKGERVLFFTESSTIQDDIVKMFEKKGITSRLLKGNNNVIRKIIEKFEKKEINVLILNPAYMGSGLNLQMADKLILLNYIDKSTETQVIGRGNRIGREGTLKVEYIFYEQEYDLYVNNGNNEKDKKTPKIKRKRITEITEEDEVSD